jgi:hypothetical protein
VARILFFVKFREDSGGNCAYDGTPNCYGGLYNSALFVVEMLNALGIEAKLVQVCDNNEIDREVTAYKPSTVIIEGLWVVPEKFVVLQRLHPLVNWIIRCHSEIPFIAYEGVAMDWLTKYVQYSNISIANNSLYGTRDFESIISAANRGWNQDELERKVLYLPNWYPPVEPIQTKAPDNVLDVGCFGAIRPLKNQLIQGLAAVEWARGVNKLLRFHVNGRVEQGGGSVLKNLLALMRSTNNILVQHLWATRPQFLQRLSRMDVSMQVSFSETFDITAADSVALGIPLVTSNEVSWASPTNFAAQTNAASILKKLMLVTGQFRQTIAGHNRDRLSLFNLHSEQVWQQFANAA